MRSTRKCGFSFLVIIVTLLYLEGSFIFRIIPNEMKNSSQLISAVENPKIRLKRRDKLKSLAILTEDENEISDPEVLQDLDYVETKNTDENLEFPVIEKSEVKYISQLDKETISRPEIQSEIQKLFDRYTFTNQLGRPGCTEASNVDELYGNFTANTIPISYDDKNAPKFSDIKANNPNIRQGGAFWMCDENTKAGTENNEIDNISTGPKIAVLIPFRDRWTHLKYELAHIHPILQRQRLNYQIFVIEQDGRDTFNKGRLFNSGFMIIDALNKFDCIIFQDVDLLLEDDRTRYDCIIDLSKFNETENADQIVKHLSTYVNSFNYKIQEYHRPTNLNIRNIFNLQFLKMSLFGGVTAMTPYQYS